MKNYLDPSLIIPAAIASFPALINTTLDSIMEPIKSNGFIAEMLSVSS